MPNADHRQDGQRSIFNLCLIYISAFIKPDWTDSLIDRLGHIRRSISSSERKWLMKHLRSEAFHRNNGNIYTTSFIYIILHISWFQIKIEFKDSNFIHIQIHHRKTYVLNGNIWNYRLIGLITIGISFKRYQFYYSYFCKNRYLSN